MKRYEPYVPMYSRSAQFEADPEGKWLKYEDVKNLEAENAQLKELNREMVEALKHMRMYYKAGKDISDCAFNRAMNALAKAEEGEGE